MQRDSVDREEHDRMPESFRHPVLSSSVVTRWWSRFKESVIADAMVIVRQSRIERAIIIPFSWRGVPFGSR